MTLISKFWLCSRNFDFVLEISTLFSNWTKKRFLYFLSLFLWPSSSSVIVALRYLKTKQKNFSGCIWHLSVSQPVLCTYSVICYFNPLSRCFCSFFLCVVSYIKVLGGLQNITNVCKCFWMSWLVSPFLLLMLRVT